MKALAVTGAGALELVEASEVPPGPGQVGVEMSTVGICATDREMVRTNSIFSIPEGDTSLVLGHEGLGVVRELGKDVTTLAVGNVVVPVAYIGEHTHQVGHVEAPCRIDMCPSGIERRRGINAHGFFRDSIVDDAAALIRVPSDIADIAMLLEPLTVSLKALTRAHLQRQEWLELAHPLTVEQFPQKVLVVGAGPIGLLGVLLSRVYGWTTVVVDLAPPESLKAQIVRDAGADYVAASSASREELRDLYGEFDIVLDAVQDPHVYFNYVDLLAMGGVFALVGWSARPTPGEIDLTAHIRSLLDKHVAVLTSVGARTDHYVDGMSRLVQMRESLGPVLERMITARYPIERFAEGFAAGGPDEIKTVLDFNPIPGASRHG